MTARWIPPGMKSHHSLADQRGAFNVKALCGRLVNSMAIDLPEIRVTCTRCEKKMAELRKLAG